MKKSFIVIALVLVIFAQIGSRPAAIETRVDTCVMIWNLDGEDGILQDANNRKWYFEDPEDLEAGDIVTVTFDTNGTENVNDDVVIAVKYSCFDSTAQVVYKGGVSCLMSSELFNIN